MITLTTTDHLPNHPDLITPTSTTNMEIREFMVNRESHIARMKEPRKSLPFSTVYFTVSTWDIEVPSPSASAVNPFDELARQNQFLIRNNINSIRTNDQIHEATRIADRLQSLIDADEEDNEEIRLKPKSIQCFRDFLAKQRLLKYPSIAITPSGEIYAEWLNGKDHILSIVFLPDGIVHFVLFLPNKDRPNQIFRIRGEESNLTILENLQNYGINELVV